MMLCETGYTQVMNEKLPDEKNFVADSEALFDTICVGCTDINRPPHRRHGWQRGIVSCHLVSQQVAAFSSVSVLANECPGRFKQVEARS
jgi:hypothetical protein